MSIQNIHNFKIGDIVKIEDGLFENLRLFWGLNCNIENKCEIIQVTFSSVRIQLKEKYCWTVSYLDVTKLKNSIKRYII